MKFSIIISPIDKNSNAMIHACQFIQALLDKNLQISAVFIYGCAVNMSTKAQLTNQTSWIKFAHSGIELLACSTIADEVLSDDEELHPCFKLAGLGQWMESIHTSDKYIEFK